MMAPLVAYPLYLRVRNRIYKSLGRRPRYECPIAASLRQFQLRHRPGKPVDHSLAGGPAIVVPCYNHAQYLEYAIQSVASQTYRPLEVLFVEDRSTDDTFDRLRRLASGLPGGIRPRILRTPRNCGQAHAINLGVTHSEASLIMILNDDDYLMHDAVEAAVNLFERNPDMFLLGAGNELFSGSGGPPGEAAARLVRTRFPDYGAIPRKRFLPQDAARFVHPNDINMAHSGSSFHKAAWRAVGGYYPDKFKRVVKFSDRDFQLRVASLFPVAIADAASFSYWRSGSSVDAGRNS